jgi:hypothetical protein
VVAAAVGFDISPSCPADSSFVIVVVARELYSSDTADQSSLFSGSRCSPK